MMKSKEKSIKNPFRRSRLSLFWRTIRYWWQRRTRGWDDSITWNLDQQLAMWLAPRLRRFYEVNNGFPCDTTMEAWDEELDEMIWAAEWYAKNAYDIGCDPKDWDRSMNGLQQVTKRLRELWW